MTASTARVAHAPLDRYRDGLILFGLVSGGLLTIGWWTLLGTALYRAIG